MSTRTQREHFERAHDRYQNHYYDKYSIFYREKIILEKLKGEFLDAKKILEIGCGGGANFREFRRLGLVKDHYHAIDISPSAIKEFQKLAP